MHLSRFRRAAVALSTAAMALTVVGPAAAVDPKPEFVTERNYFTCDGTTKVAQANLVVDGELPSWATLAPTQSVQSGAGCGAYEVALLGGTNQASIYDASWEGTFTGNIRDIALDLHFIQPATAAFGELNLDLRLAIDGTEYDLSGQFATAPAIASSTGASYSVQMALNDIDIIDDQFGPGNKTHTYTITADGHFVDTDAAVAFVWGTTEVPGGLTFNADTKGMPGVSVR